MISRERIRELVAASLRGEDVPLVCQKCGEEWFSCAHGGVILRAPLHSLERGYWVKPRRELVRA